MDDVLRARGVYTLRCEAPDGRLLWERVAENVVATVGKNLAFNVFLNGAGYTVTGPFLGLISATGFSGVAASDTMSSHPGWQEAGSVAPPSYSGTRALCNWAPAINGLISLATPAAFMVTGLGAVQGAFIVYGPGASSVPGNASGTLWSAGIFTGGPASVSAGYSLQANYTVSM